MANSKMAAAAQAQTSRVNPEQAVRARPRRLSSCDSTRNPGGVKGHIE
jgi:hypothetical protein